MDKETAKYIIDYFSNLLTAEERMAIRHSHSLSKISGVADDSNMAKIYRQKGWISSDQQVLDLLKDGYDAFEINVAARVLNQTPDQVFFNNCPKCKKLARTPYARQCRFCGHQWHDLVVAQFKLYEVFQITGRAFFLSGQITEGIINEGNFMDLTLLGLSKRPTIETIEFVLKKQDGKVWEDVALGTHELTEEEKLYLKNKSTGASFDILSAI